MYQGVASNAPSQLDIQQVYKPAISSQTGIDHDLTSVTLLLGWIIVLLSVSQRLPSTSLRTPHSPKSIQTKCRYCTQANGQWLRRLDSSRYTASRQH